MQDDKSLQMWELSCPSLSLLSEDWSPCFMGKTVSSRLLQVKYFQHFRRRRKAQTLALSCSMKVFRASEIPNVSSEGQGMF